LSAASFDTIKIAEPRGAPGMPYPPLIPKRRIRSRFAKGRHPSTSGRSQSGVLRWAAPLALLGDIRSAEGRATDAAASYDLVRQVEALNREAGVAVDLELARFEADHAGEDAVAMARAAREARPTAYADDTLGWALRLAGRPAEALPYAQAAVRLGTAD